MYCYRSLVFSCCLDVTDISQDREATHLRRAGSLEIMLLHIFPILTVKKI